MAARTLLAMTVMAALLPALAEPHLAAAARVGIAHCLRHHQLAALLDPAVARPALTDPRVRRRLAGFAKELHAPAAAAVVEPDRTGRDGAARNIGLARGDEIAIGRPGRVVQQLVGFVADLLEVLAVDAHGPDVLGAGTVADERDPVAVRAEARLEIPGDALGQRDRIAAADGQSIQVAEKIEYQEFAVRADVDGRPADLVGVDFDRPPFARGILDRPGIVALDAFIGLGILRRGWHRQRRNECEDERDRKNS